MPQVRYAPSAIRDLQRLRNAFATNPEPVIITQNGEAKMVVMDIVEYEKLQEIMALLKLLALGKKEFNDGKFSDAEAFLDQMDD